MMHSRIISMLAVVGMAMSALGFSKAFDRVGDRWSFDIPSGTDPMEAKFTTPYHPVRVAEAWRAWRGRRSGARLAHRSAFPPP